MHARHSRSDVRANTPASTAATALATATRDTPANSRNAETPTTNRPISRSTAAGSQKLPAATAPHRINELLPWRPMGHTRGRLVSKYASASQTSATQIHPRARTSATCSRRVRVGSRGRARTNTWHPSNWCTTLCLCAAFEEAMVRARVQNNARAHTPLYAHAAGANVSGDSQEGGVSRGKALEFAVRYATAVSLSPHPHPRSPHTIATPVHATAFIVPYHSLCARAARNCAWELACDVRVLTRNELLLRTCFPAPRCRAPRRSLQRRAPLATQSHHGV